MENGYSIVVCGGIVPDPLQALQPVQGPGGPALKNEMMLPAILDPLAWHALFEAADLARRHPESEVWLVSISPKAKLQQVMMGVAQKAPFELVAVDGPANGFVDAAETASVLADAIRGLEGMDSSRLLLFGGWQSASRGTGAVLQMVGEILEIEEQFQGVDKLTVDDEGGLEILERIEGGAWQKSRCAGPPAVLGWATGSLPEPPGNPQIGMQNMRMIMPALQRAKAAEIKSEGLSYRAVETPGQRRDTRVESDMDADAIADEIVAWLRG
jgi:electron transfer flavoprotein beta subunit